MFINSLAMHDYIQLFVIVPLGFVPLVFHIIVYRRLSASGKHVSVEVAMAGSRLVASKAVRAEFARYL